MSGFSLNIEKATVKNENFRQVLFTGPKSQLVLMSLLPGEDIGVETHPETDQFIRVEAGQGEAVIDGEKIELEDGSALVIPAGAEHNITNVSKTDKLKLYTVYSPPEHEDGLVARTKQEAEQHEH